MDYLIVRVSIDECCLLDRKLRWNLWLAIVLMGFNHIIYEISNKKYDVYMTIFY